MLMLEVISLEPQKSKLGKIFLVSCATFACNIGVMKTPNSDTLQLTIEHINSSIYMSALYFAEFIGGTRPLLMSFFFETTECN